MTIPSPCPRHVTHDNVLYHAGYIRAGGPILDDPEEPKNQLPATIMSAAVTADQRAPNVVPTLIADLGDEAAWRYVEFFTANIRNPHTRRAYARACARFFAWCEDRRLTPAAIRPHDVATYIEELQAAVQAPSVKQQLAAVRMLFDWLVIGQVVPTNPAAAVRGPKHVVKTGKTPVLEGTEWRKLLKSIPDTTLRDLRDRALIATLTYSFARINAALKMKVEDLRPRGAGWTVRLHEKGGKQHAMPCHHALAEALRAYIDAAGLAPDRKGWLFRTARGHNGSALSDKPMSQPDAWRMIRRRATAAGITAPIGCHTFRATGITAYLANGGALEHAQEMAAHESPRTTKLYDRTKERLTQDEVERIRL
jgi:site-specific recombinase XerD